MAIEQKYKDLFATPDGMEVLADIMERGKIYAPLNGEKDIGRSDLAKEIMLRALADRQGTDENGRPFTLLDGTRFKKLLQRVFSHKLTRMNTD